MCWLGSISITGLTGLRQLSAEVAREAVALQISKLSDVVAPPAILHDHPQQQIAALPSALPAWADTHSATPEVSEGVTPHLSPGSSSMMSVSPPRSGVSDSPLRPPRPSEQSEGVPISSETFVFGRTPVRAQSLVVATPSKLAIYPCSGDLGVNAASERGGECLWYCRQARDQES